MKQEIKIPAGCEVDAITTEEGADDVNLDNPGVANRNKANLKEEVAKMKQAKPLDSDDGTPSRLSSLFTE